MASCQLLVRVLLKKKIRLIAFEEHSGSFGRALDWGIERLLVGTSLTWVSLCCVIEQDTVSAALYWFNPGRLIPT